MNHLHVENMVILFHIHTIKYNIHVFSRWTIGIRNKTQLLDTTSLQNLTLK